MMGGGGVICMSIMWTYSRTSYRQREKYISILKRLKNTNGSVVRWFFKHSLLNSVAFSPQANCTDGATATE
jgi:hypothetical protein